MTRIPFLASIKAVFGLWVALALPGCGGGGSSTFPISGRAIQEFVGGAVGSIPTDRPIAHLTLTFNNMDTGAEAARLTTDGLGNFSTSLPVGTFVVRVPNQAREPIFQYIVPSSIVVRQIGSNNQDIVFVMQTP